jgi:hypothetical protein
MNYISLYILLQTSLNSDKSPFYERYHGGYPLLWYEEKLEQNQYLKSVSQTSLK